MGFPTVSEIVCIVICALHAILGMIKSRLLSKKVDALCSFCGSAIVTGQQHDCVLTDEQLQALTVFVNSLKR